MRKTFIDKILAAIEKYPEMMILLGDSGLGVFDDFQRKFPDQFINTGVAEQNATGLAAGLAITGSKVMLYNISPFVLYRCYEQVRNDICYQGLPVILVGIGSGVTYAPQGMTHYSVEDIGLCKTLPGLQVFSPADPVEAGKIAEFCLETDKPVYIRLAKQGEDILHTSPIIDITRPQVLQEGTDIALVCHGSIASEVVQAHHFLLQEGISSRMLTIPLIQPIPFDELTQLLHPIKNIVIIEEHFHNCGVGNTLVYHSHLNESAWNISVLGIDDVYIHEVKNQKSLREQFGISARKIVSHVLYRLKR